MPPRRFPSWLTRGGPEIVITAGATLGCFVLILAMLGLALREGGSLQELMRDREDLGAWSFASDRGGLDITTTGAADEVVAILTVADNHVKDKRANELAWASAEVGTPLRNRHSVQTFSQSRAVITFDEQNELELAENSLIVIQNHRRSPTAGMNRTSLRVLDGELKVRLSNASDDSVRLDIATKGSTRLHVGEDRPGPTSFRVAVGDDGRSTFAVYEGALRVESEGGSRELSPDQAVSVDSVGALGDPVPLPVPPTLLSPADGTAIVFREQSPRVRFSWSGSSVEGWEFVLATDPALSKVVHRERLVGESLMFGNLPPGDLYWGVAGVGGGVLGRTERGGPVRVVRDLRPPSLDVAFPEEVVTDSVLTLAGRTDPGVAVYVGDRRVAASPDGSFEIEMTVDPGLNLVVVEAVDSAGNAAYRSKRITVRY